MGCRSFIRVGSSARLCWQAELYTGAIDCIDHGSKRVGEDGAPVVAGILASPTPLSRRSDILLAQANAALTNALDGFEVPSESVRCCVQQVPLVQQFTRAVLIMQSSHPQPHATHCRLSATACAVHRGGMVVGGGAWRYLSKHAWCIMSRVLLLLCFVMSHRSPWRRRS